MFKNLVRVVGGHANRVNSRLASSSGQKQPKLKVPSQIVSPKLEVPFALQIEKISAVELSQKAIIWIQVDKLGNILDWSHKEIDPSAASKKATFDEIYESLYDIYSNSLPKDSQAILIESKKYATTHSQYMTVMLNLQRLETIFQCIIKAETAREAADTTKIFNMSARGMAKKFEIFVGNERVKSAGLVETLIRSSQAGLDPLAKNNEVMLNISDELKQNYLQSAKELKEPMALSYLRATCFYNIYKKLVDQHLRTHLLNDSTA